jgi:hypothetical protein
MNKIISCSIVKDLICDPSFNLFQITFRNQCRGGQQEKCIFLYEQDSHSETLLNCGTSC